MFVSSVVGDAVAEFYNHWMLIIRAKNTRIIPLEGAVKEDQERGRHSKWKPGFCGKRTVTKPVR